MDQNTELLLSRIAQPIRWEDEEKATNDVEQLRAEFRQRLYGNGDAPTPAENQSSPAPRTDK